MAEGTTAEGTTAAWKAADGSGPAGRVLDPGNTTDGQLPRRCPLASDGRGAL